jgi:peptidyl-prolyl cis-trans isomerase C
MTDNRRNKHRWIYVTLLLALGLSACASVSTPEVVPTPTATSTPLPPTATPEPMAVTVNGEGITLAEFNAEVTRYTAAKVSLGNIVDPAAASVAVLDDLVAQLLLAQAARANGFTLDEAALQARSDALAAQIGGAQALSAWQTDQGYSEQAFRSALKRSAESAWMRDRIVSNVPSTAEQVHVQQILLYNQDMAVNFYGQLNFGADFNDLAFQADPWTRGDLGWVPRGYLLEPLIEAAAFGLEVGAYSEVITTGVGFHIVRVLERDPNRQLAPDALLTLQEQAVRKWIEEQRAQANVVIAP